jgi:hypothetical protein
MTHRDTIYFQCHLTRTEPDGTLWHTIGFIPARHAIVGKRLRLTIGKHTRDNWIVAGAGTTPYSGELLQEQGRDYKRMRKASDI